MSSRHRIPEVSAAGRAAAEALRREVSGAVLTSPLQRWLYSTDASIYRVVPEAVLVAGHPDDLAAAASAAATHGVPLVARGAATSVAGQAVGPGIVVDCFRLDRIVGIDAGTRTARVQPGVIQASLNAAAARHGLELGPDTATVEQATIGGMVGNNSSGSRSIIHGETKDAVRRVSAVLTGGAVLDFGQCRGTDLGSGVRGAGGAGLAAALGAIREQHRESIAAGFPQTERCTSGYNLRELLRPAPNLARLLAGSEGTLALFTELEVGLVPRPALRLGAALVFATLAQALEANLALLSTGPSAVELVDLDPLRGAPGLSSLGRAASLLDGAGRAMLAVEYQGEADEAHAGLSRLRSLAPELGAAQVVWLVDAAALADVAALRRAVLPLLMGAPGAERPASFVEDTAVAPGRLAAFAADFERLVATAGARASFTGHASAGCLHVRPLLDLKSAAGVRDLERLAGEVGRLVASYQGAISGEHGCGRARSWLLPELLGAGLYGAMVALKDAFDADRLLGPGVVVDGPGVADSLRFGADYRAGGAWSPRLSYEGDGGFDFAVERCFGAGLCKKLSGTMCPPAAATRAEARTTRARANALQGVLCGAIPLSAIGEAEFADVLGTCVACKACKSECPAGVDMAALKAEWLAELHARNGTPPLARVVGGLRRVAAFASAAAPLVNAAGRTGMARRVAARMGAAPERPLPRFARRPLTRRLHGARAPGAASLFLDCFIQYQEPGVGEALARLCEAAGVRLALLDAGCCGRTDLSVGRIEQARVKAARALECLGEHAAAGGDILFIEPSCLSMVVDDWPRLLPGDPRVVAVSAAARPATELVAELAEAGRLRFRAGGRAVLHTHCHEKALAFSDATRRALAAIPGLDLEILDAGCCGMAGVFGYEAEHFAASVAMAERSLLPAVRAAVPETVVLATGTSCRSQIRDLAGRAALHPLELLAARLAPGPGSGCGRA